MSLCAKAASPYLWGRAEQFASFPTFLGWREQLSGHGPSGAEGCGSPVAVPCATPRLTAWLLHSPSLPRSQTPRRAVVIVAFARERVRGPDVPSCGGREEAGINKAPLLA